MGMEEVIEIILNDLAAFTLSQEIEEKLLPEIYDFFRWRALIMPQFISISLPISNILCLVSCDNTKARNNHLVSRACIKIPHN